MNNSMLSVTEIEPCIRTGKMPPNPSICSIADILLAIEKIRKDPNAAELHEKIRNGKTTFQCSCKSGNILCIPLDSQSLIDEPFVDPYSAGLELDPSLFETIAPEDSLRAIAFKQLARWGW